MTTRDDLLPDSLDPVLRRLDLDEVDRQVVLDWAGQLDDADLARIELLRDRVVAAWDAPLHPERERGPLFEDQDATHRLGAGVLPVFALALAAGPMAELDRAQGYPDEVVRATQADLGQQMRTHRAVHGSTGLDTQWWVAQVFSAGFARLGRLQFELARSELGMGEGNEVWVLSTHIPGDGRMTDEAVDESFALASTFFEEHHPEVGPIDWFVCYSWLLDPALTVLVPGSNMAKFAARWDVWKAFPNDRDAYYFGFGIEPPKGVELPYDLDALPTDNRLHAAMVEHWRAGEHFMLCCGRIP